LVDAASGEDAVRDTVPLDSLAVKETFAAPAAESIIEYSDTETSVPSHITVTLVAVIFVFCFAWIKYSAVVNADVKNESISVGVLFAVTRTEADVTDP
jgi:hypothetical protein